MLQRKLYQFSAEQRPVWVFLRDQQRWIEQARILEIEGDCVTLRYDAEEEDELHSWEEISRHPRSSKIWLLPEIAELQREIYGG